MPTRTPEALDAPLLFERQESFRGGVDGHAPAALLGPEQVAAAVNCILTSRNEIANRPGLAYLEQRIGPQLPPTGMFYFDTPTLEQLLVFGPGLVWTRDAVDGTYGWTGQGLGSPGPTLPAAWPGTGRMAAAQGIDKLLCSDGTNACVLYDGTTWTSQGEAVTEAGDPPKGATMLLWHPGGGRMFASGVGTYPDTIWASDLLEFGTGHWNHVNWSLRVGQGDGQAITALGWMPRVAAGATAASYLVVSKTNSIYVVTVDPTQPSAANWTIGDPLTEADGIAGPEAIVAVGNDTHYWGNDGVRSIGRMAGAAGQWEVSEPMSRPMQPYVDRVNPAARDRIKTLRYGELVLWAVPLDDATTPDTILVWSQRHGAWCGVWTGWTVLGWVRSRFEGVPHLDVVTDANTIGRWMDDQDRADPDTFSDFEQEVDFSVTTRALRFGDPDQEKDLLCAEFELREAQADVTLTVTMDEEPVKTVELDSGYTALVLDANPALCPMLPFTLPVAGARSLSVPLDFLPHGREAQFTLSGRGGNFQLKGWRASALPGMLRCQ